MKLLKRIIFISILFAFLSKSFATVIILNGTPSAGKSSLAQAFNNLSGNDYKILRLDDFILDYLITHGEKLGYGTISSKQEVKDLIDKLPVKAHGRRIDKTKELWIPLYQTARTYALQGKNVIIDTVLATDHDEIIDCFNLLNNLNPLLVLVYCPFAQLKQRVDNRNKSGVAGESRLLSTVFRDALAIYTVADEKTTVVDVLPKQTFISILHTITCQLTAYPDVMKQLINDFTAKFDLNHQDIISITSELVYDVIVDTGKQNPDECAHYIENYLVHNKNYQAASINFRSLTGQSLLV